MKNIFILAVLAAVGTACSSLPKEQCAQPDWARIGKIDGERGEMEQKYFSHLKNCELSLNPLDEAVYKKAWGEGNTKFCTPENGYKVGMMSFASGEACDKKKYPEFSEQFNLGRKVAELRIQRNQIRTEIEEKSEKEGGGARIAKALFGYDPNRDLRQQDEKLTEKIDLLEENAPVNLKGVNETQMALRTYGPEAQNYTGAFVGTLTGFGIGHAIQGRYLEDGWKWTLGEVGTIGLMVATANDCQTTSANGNTQSTCSGANPWAVLGWLGFRVWQSYALFSFASKESNVYALPTANGGIVGYRF